MLGSLERCRQISLMPGLPTQACDPSSKIPQKFPATSQKSGLGTAGTVWSNEPPAAPSQGDHHAFEDSPSDSAETLGLHETVSSANAKHSAWGERDHKTNAGR